MPYFVVLVDAFGFGRAHDKYICSNDHTGINIFGYNYRYPDYPAGSKIAKSILAGSEYFKTVEIEVFTLKN